MVSNMSIFFMAVSTLVCFLLPVIVTIYYYKKEKISIKVVLIGALVFFVFALVLEQGMHYFMFFKIDYTKNILDNPWIYMLYGGLAAGLFEETGRFLAFKTFLKKNREWKDGLAYGIGHGSLEAVLIGGLAGINNIANSLMINSGGYDAIIKTVSSDKMLTLQTIKNQLIHSSPYLLGVAGLERIFAFVIQIALSILIVKAVRANQAKYYILAVVIHAVIDFPAALFQKGVLKNIYIIELLVFIFAVLGVIYIVKSKKAESSLYTWGK